MNQIVYNFKRLIRNYANGGFILIAVTTLAMVMANSTLSSSYFDFWEQTFRLQIGDFNFFSYKGENMTLIQIVNDFLMAIFFFTIGLEIKREIRFGELSTVRTALLPIIGAIGGMVLPVGIYLFFSHHGLESRGCAIPMATDIAFSLGVLSLFGKRVPNGLKVFLAALAVADDLGGIAVIAIFYTGNIDITAMIYASLSVLFLIIGNRRGVRNKLYYCIGGLILWYFLLNSGIHATIAGVIAAFCIPASGKATSPLQEMEKSLAPFVGYFIIPLFAFANAGISLSGITMPDIFTGVGLSALAGLSVGKVIGIVFFSWLAIRLKIVHLPFGTSWKMFIGVAMLGGIGFTVSIFIADLSFSPFGEEGYRLLNNAKLGILTGSILAGVTGYAILSLALPENKKQFNTILNQKS